MIEEAIAKLTAAIEAHTAALLKSVQADKGDTSEKPAETSKAKASATPPTKTKAAAKAPAEVEAPAEEEAIEVPDGGWTLNAAVVASKAFLAKDRDGNKPKLAALRAEFGVDTVAHLPLDQVKAYMTKLAKL